jgi:tyrosine-protein kinase Etk/Wzc
MAIPGERPEVNVVGMSQTPGPRPGALGPQDEVSLLASYLNVLWEGRWLIAGALAAAALGLVAYLVIATPIYESDVLLQIEQHRQGSAQALSDLPTALAGPQSQADTEIEVLQSRKLLGGVVDALNLDVSVSPVYFPVIGRAWARLNGGMGPAAAPWGLASFGWGGEAIHVSRFDVPPELANSTVHVLLVAGTRQESRTPPATSGSP